MYPEFHSRSEKDAKVPQAQISALGSIELLELILHQLSTQDLLLSQTVCRTWHQLISTSPRLQQDLFFKPIARATGDDEGEERWCQNPLLQERFPPFFTKLARTGRGSWPTMRSGHDLLNLDWTRGVERYEAYARPDASWRRMLVIQPPIHELKVERITTSMGGTGMSETNFARPDGLRMETLVSIVIQMVVVARHSSSGFVVRWNMFKSPERRTNTIMLGLSTSLSCVYVPMSLEMLSMSKIVQQRHEIKWKSLVYPGHGAVLPMGVVYDEEDVIQNEGEGSTCAPFGHLADTPEDSEDD